MSHDKAFIPRFLEFWSKFRIYRQFWLNSQVKSAARLLESIPVSQDTATRHLVRDFLSFGQNFVKILIFSPILSEFSCQICCKAFRVNPRVTRHSKEAWSPRFLKFWSEFFQFFKFMPILSKLPCQICTKAFRVNSHVTWHCNKAFGPRFLEFLSKF